MKTTTRANLHTISILSIGIMIGSFGFGNASADDTTTTTATAPTIPAGEMIKVLLTPLPAQPDPPPTHSR